MGNGLVVVPMLQRLLAAGSRRLQHDSVAECGQIGAGDLQLKWTSAETDQPGNVQTQAGVYKNGDRWLVVNRPAAEDEFERVEDSAVGSLFGTLSFQLFPGETDDTALQSEIWRLFLFLMLLALMAEAWLTRAPGSMAQVTPPKTPTRHRMSHWSFAASLIVILAGIGEIGLAAWLGWGNWQRNGRRGKVALLEVSIRGGGDAGFTLLQPEYIRLTQGDRPAAGRHPQRRLGSMQTRDVVSTNDIVTRTAWIDTQNKRAYWTPLEAGSKVLPGRSAAAGRDRDNALGQAREIGTDLSGALGSVLRQQRNLKAVLLLTDGDWNLGPRRSAWPRAIAMRVSPFTVLSPVGMSRLPTSRWRRSPRRRTACLASRSPYPTRYRATCRAM
ncbi:MAG: hypothetical protein Ct9H300mP32_0330 [Verrucomicrobiota bacterium]|nr:MAG: hypothetical protein Ct9H300mP32_0330 [Verrucomicrobiota bacterium]